LIRDESDLRSAVVALLSSRRDVRAVAAETGLSKTTVSELRGRRRAISQDALGKIAGRYDPVRIQDWEGAWRRVYGERTGTRVGPAPPTPRELPLDIAGFSGRGPELAELKRAADRGGAVVVITGTAGVGKTTLAVHWAHKVQRQYPDGSIYVDLHGYDEQDPASAASVIAAVAGRLGHDRPDLPTNLDALAAVYRTILAGRRILLVLDNAHSTEQVLPLLPGTFDGTAVITSRDDLTVLRSRFGIRRLALDTLPMDDAVVTCTVSGGRSNTCLLSIPTSGASTRSAPQPEHGPGSCRCRLFGSSTSASVEPGCPGCPPGLRPLLPRSDLAAGFANGESDDGGLDEFCELCPSRALNSAT
jgi:energy-coupling factor transporter ATP-binding protein EcfA2